MKRKKQCGYFWKIQRQLKSFGTINYKWVDDGSLLGKKSVSSYSVKIDALRHFSPKARKYIVRNAFYFKKIFFVLLFLVCSSFAFQGVGDCQKVLQDYAQLTNKSAFLPHLLDGNCIVQSEKHLPLIMKNAGFNYVEKNGTLSIKPIVYKEKEPEQWQPKDLYYDVEFLFVNVSSILDCGFRMDDVFFRLQNLDYSFSLGLNLGCPALDYDGSFAFKVNAHLLESWQYSHGTENQRQRAQITSSTGAVTNEYDYITTGLNLSLNQTQKGVFFSLKYTGNNGSVTTSSGGVVDEVKATITDEFTRKRKFWIVPIGVEKVRATYTLILRVTPVNR